MVKQEFDVPLTPHDIKAAHEIIASAIHNQVTTIINVGTSLIESQNCVELAKSSPTIHAVVGIHPNDCTSTWRSDMQEIKNLVKNREKNKIVGIGECGIDKHYPDYNLDRQQDVFRMHIDLALEYNLALVVHTRDAAHETLMILDEYAHESLRAVIHCFSEHQWFADHVLQKGFFVGIGGPLTYPKNHYLRDIFSTIDINHIVLETDAPFLPPQSMRGKQNNPAQIKTIAEFLAQLRGQSFEYIAQETTRNAQRLFKLKNT